MEKQIENIVEDIKNDIAQGDFSSAVHSVMEGVQIDELVEGGISHNDVMFIAQLVIDHYQG